MRLSNAFGTAPLHIAAAHIAVPVASGSDAIHPGSDRALTFGGAGDVTIPAGAEYVSDPVAQTLAPGYTYKGFCAKARAAGCAGYIVSFTGRRAVYFGRTAEIHVEHFPST